jgi:hypothetical protein
MKVLILVIITTWSFASGYYHGPDYQVMPSIERAALTVYEDKYARSFQIEPDHKEFHLYEVDFKANSIKEIPIPIVKIERNGSDVTLP